MPVLPLMRLLLIAFIPMAAAAMLRFRVPGAKRLLAISQGDLTRWVPPAQPSAIVNAANERCLGGGGVDGAIHKAAGPELRKLCEALPEVAPGVRCPTGDAVSTKACGALQSTHVIYTVGPNVSGRRYESDVSGDATTDPAKLPAAYRRTFEVASELGLAAVALPAVSCGVFGYPLADAARIGTRAAVASNIDHVEFVLYSDDLYDIFANAAEDACGPPEVT